MSSGKVSREIIDRMMLIGLDRVAKRNAFDSHMIEDLSLALTEYENNPELRCAVIFAHGDHFTAGLDLVELQPKIPQGIFCNVPSKLPKKFVLLHRLLYRPYWLRQPMR